MPSVKRARRGAPLPPIRVRHEPPTLEEAVFASQGLSDDAQEQVEIAAGLMGVTVEEAAPAVLAYGAKPPTAQHRSTRSVGSTRVVVLKRRSVR